MCGRFTQAYTWQELVALYRLTVPASNLQPRYNIAPTTTIDTIIPRGADRLELTPMRWGLIPYWWKKTAKEVPSTFLRRFDGSDPAIDAAYGMIRSWAHAVKLNLDPELPKELRNRPADNWRPLVAIADSFGRAWGASARDAAIYFSRTHRDEDAAVILLNDIRLIFNDHDVDRLASAALVEELVGMDDAMWSEWRGRHDDQQPRHLSQGELARLLAPFGIRPKSIWPRRRRQGSKSSKGYLRTQFENAWRAYGDSTGTPSQASPIGKLRRR